LDIGNLAEGAYKVELRVNDDIITDQIISKQSKLSFINCLWLADGAKDIELKTDSPFVSAQTINPASLQTIKVGGNNLILNKTYRQFDAVCPIKSELASIKFEKGDVILSGNGVFSFNQDSFIKPVVKKLDNSIDVNANGINYVIAKYQMPKEEGTWQIAEAEFDLTNTYQEGPAYQLGSTNKMNFLISIPGLNAEDDVDDKIIFGKTTVKLSGRSLLDKIKAIFYEKN